MPRLTTQQFNEVKELYNTGDYNLPALGKMYNISKEALNTRLTRSGIKVKNHSQAKRKYNVNENYFSVIDSEDKAYFLGLLYADGYIHIKTNSVNLSLNYKDKEVLQRLNNFIQDRPLQHIVDRKGVKNDMYRIVVNSSIMVNDLIKHGCYQAKTYSLQFPNFLSDELMRHFVRGHLDGDGCIHNSLKIPGVSFVGSQNYMLGFKDYLKSNLDIHLTTSQPERYKYNITKSSIGGGKNVRKFLNWIYKDCTIFFERKQIRYLQLLEYFNIFSNKEKKSCKIENCERKYHGNEYCQYHYNKLLNYPR